MKKLIIAYSLILAMVLQTLCVRANETVEPVTIKANELFSQAAVLMDATTGRVLYGKNTEIQLPMASTTKIMTCIVALEEGDLDEVVTASQYASIQPKVKLYLKKGEQFVLKDLLFSLMLESHNDSAVAIAEHIGAKLLGMNNDLESVKNRGEKESKEAVKAFINCMNEKAKELQCYQTWFITPNGLDAKEVYSGETGESIERVHSTTAEELARIMSYCILFSPKKDEFLDITRTYNYSFQNLEKSRSFSCANHNAFLNMMNGALSGKTGYTGNAGYCYVGALEQDDRYYVVALLNSGAYGNKTRKWTDTKKLMNYGLEYYHYQEVYSGDAVANPVKVHNAKPVLSDYFGNNFINTEISENSPVNVLMADWEKVELTLEQETELTAPVRKGEIVGALEVKLNGEVKAHFPIVCTNGIEEKVFFDTIEFVLQRFLLNGVKRQ